MNKSKSDNWRTLHILLTFFVVMLALSIYAIYSFKIYNESVEDREVYVKDNKYKVILEQVYEVSIFIFSLNRTKVTVGKKVGDEWIYKEPFEMSYRIRGVITKENYTIDWIDGGVIIKVTGVEKEKDMTYRVYWEDVF